MRASETKSTISLSSSEKWREWLTKNHHKSNGIWLRIFKKTSDTPSITYDEALDEALCFGWIDGQKNRYDEESWLQKFTPRRAKSIWSKRNREHITRLTKEKRMQPGGLREVEAAKRDGRWDNAYDSPKNMEMPADFLKELKKNKKAYEFFLGLNRTNTYTIAWRLQTAKKHETREKRMTAILEMMRNGKRFY